MTVEKQNLKSVTRYGAGTMVIVVSFVIFFGVWFAGNRFPSAPSLEGWIYPGATTEEVVEDVQVSSRLCATTDDFKKVADYYSGQLGLKGTGGGMTIMSSRGPFVGSSALASLAPDRRSIQSRTFLKRTKAGLIAIHISRSPAHKQTQVLLCGTRLAWGANQSGPKTTLLKSWEYPGANRGSQGTGGALEMGNYSSSDAVETISQFYLNKFGLPAGASVPGKIVSLIGRTNTPSSVPEKVLVLETGKTAELANTTLMKLGDDVLILVQLSRGEGEDQTQISLSVATK
jgi:hypothetical protein